MSILKQGKSNKITIAQGDDCVLLRKFFANKLVGYDVNWPVSRRYAEEYAYKHLSEITSECKYISVPKLFSQFSDGENLVMEFINAKSINQLIDENSSLLFQINDEQLTSLLSILIKIQKIDYSSLSDNEKTVLEKQKEIAACMYLNKHENSVSVLDKNPWYYCLGDVSLNNILFDGSSFYLVDHECVHMGYYGYDIGQLLGMTKAKSINSNIAQKLYLNLSKGLANLSLSEEELQSIYKWEESFFKYYSKRLPLSIVT